MKDKDGNFALWKGVIAGMSAGMSHARDTMMPRSCYAATLE
jgi:hypothetical protein